MGQPQVEKQKYSIEEWLALEESTGVRYEYHFGEVFSMAGGTSNHGTIADNTFFETEAHNRARGGKCRSLSSEFKTVISEKGRYVYPDTAVVCGEVDWSDTVKGAVKNPILVVEVVSDSSEGYDRGEKFRYYRRLPSIKEYLILDQKKAAAILHRRNGSGDIFSTLDYEGMEVEIELTSIDLKLELGAFYRNVNFNEVD